MLPLNKILVINKNDRPERLAHMTAELARWNRSFERVEAYPVTDSCRFSNKAIRSNWLSHELCLHMAANNQDNLTMILEDDIIIEDFPKIDRFVEDVQKFQDWDVLYLYGSKTEGVSRIRRVINTHAYVVNTDGAVRFRNALMDYRINVVEGTPKKKFVVIDFLTRKLQGTMNFYGTPELVYQDRETFGSDLGWGLHNTPKRFD